MKAYHLEFAGANGVGVNYYCNDDFHLYKYQNSITNIAVKTDTMIPVNTVPIKNVKGNY